LSERKGGVGLWPKDGNKKRTPYQTFKGTILGAFKRLPREIAILCQEIGVKS
jgi:hypothetical protein